MYIFVPVHTGGFCVFMLSHMLVWVCGPLGIPRRLRSPLFLQTETIMGNTFGQDRTGRGWWRGGGSFSWVIPSHFQRARVSPHPVWDPDPLPPRQTGQGWQLRLQAPFHPACNSFLPPRASHLKKESDGRRGGK